jgi:NitT/TauT family transport system substrate-binding protein
MAHASRNLVSIEDVLQEGTLALQRGLPYARLLEQQFGFDHVKIVPSTGGDITAFLNDPLFAQQCFIMSEPIQARRAGADVVVFPVADIGYNPYTTVLATSGSMLRDRTGEVEKMVAAVREGWRSYLDNPKATNDRMHELNPSMDLASFAEIAEAQKPFIETEEIAGKPLGFMSKERWDKLIGQLAGLGDIDEPMPAEECFRNL